MKKINVLLLAFLLLSFWANAQQYPFNGLDMNMGNLSRLSNAQSRSISPENFTATEILPTNGSNRSSSILP